MMCRCMGFCRVVLPVCHCCVEDLVGKVSHHLRDEFLLHCGELLRGVVFGGGRELPFEVFGVFFVVGEAHVDGHFELYLAAVAVARDAFIELVEGHDLACELQVAVLLHLPQLCLVHVDLGDAVLEDALHGCPDVGASDGEVVYLYGFGGGVVDACAVEAVADGAGCEEQGKQEGHVSECPIHRCRML